jgi:hypothetical protein
MPFFDGRAATPKRAKTPATCQCSDFDYSEVAEGVIECRDCGRVWRLRGKSGWWPYPCPGCNMNPERCRHYGKREWKKTA